MPVKNLFSALLQHAEQLKKCVRDAQKHAFGSSNMVFCPATHANDGLKA